MKADLSSLDDTNRLVASIIEKGLEPTHIVHLAANNMRYARFAEWNAESVNKDMTIQVYSFAEVLKAFLPLMAKKNYGKIIVMLTSCTQGIPPKNLSGYVTVKYALLGLVKSIATDFGDQGVNINAISPGMIETKFIRNVGRKIKEFTAEKNPQHRNLNVDDVIPAMLFLLSDDCLFMNGTNLNLSGSTN
jgi:3-oxoacyl-[acyl-carrier protein] reductase